MSGSGLYNHEKIKQRQAKKELQRMFYLTDTESKYECVKNIKRLQIVYQNMSVLYKWKAQETYTIKKMSIRRTTYCLVSMLKKLLC